MSRPAGRHRGVFFEFGRFSSGTLVLRDDIVLRQGIRVPPGVELIIDGGGAYSLGKNQPGGPLAAEGGNSSYCAPDTGPWTKE